MSTGGWELVINRVHDTSTGLYQLSYHANWGLVIKTVHDTSTGLYQFSYHANSGLVIKRVHDTSTVLVAVELSCQLGAAGWSLVEFMIPVQGSTS